LIANNSLLPPLSIRYSIATRALPESLQHTKIETLREIIVPKSLDFTDPVYKKTPTSGLISRAASCTNIWSVFMPGDNPAPRPSFDENGGGPGGEGYESGTRRRVSSPTPKVALKIDS
jgi:hypothetical protein